MTSTKTHILTVSALTKAVKNSLEGHFPFVWVRGQVTNVARPASGHLYFSLRDGEASLAAVWFKQQQQHTERFDPMTGEVFEEGPRKGLAATLENGQEVVCAGKLTVYAARGTYQLIVELAEETGIGRLQAEFDRLRAKLQEQGFFALERKRLLPPAPQQIALITSPQGAAIHDFLRIAETRGSGACIRLYPVPVQGEAAPQAIAAAIRVAQATTGTQAIVLIRGGGSLEDLWAFNDERVAKAVYECPLPVLAGIGHEIDFSLADLTADVRAATPTHAAQLLWPERPLLHDKVRQYNTRLEQAGNRILSQQQQRLAITARSLQWHSPERAFVQLCRKVTDLHTQLQAKNAAYLLRCKERLAYCMAALTRSPEHKLLERQEAALSLAARMAQAVHRVHEMQSNTVHQLAHILEQAPQRLPLRQQQLDALAGQMEHNGSLRILHARHALETLALQLEAVSPLAPLDRGYAILHTPKGQIIRSTADVLPADTVQIMVHDGSLTAQVTAVTPEHPQPGKTPSSS